MGCRPPKRAFSWYAVKCSLLDSLSLASKYLVESDLFFYLTAAGYCAKYGRCLDMCTSQGWCETRKYFRLHPKEGKSPKQDVGIPPDYWEVNLPNKRNLPNGSFFQSGGKSQLQIAMPYHLFWAFRFWTLEGKGTRHFFLIFCLHRKKTVLLTGN